MTALKDMFGMTVKKLESTERGAVYELTGPRGGKKYLYRNSGNRRLMYVTDKHGNIVSIRGNYTFADNGEQGLRPVYRENLYQ